VISAGATEWRKPTNWPCGLQPNSSELAKKHQLNGTGDHDNEVHKNQYSTAFQNFPTSLDTNTFKDQKETPSLFGKLFLESC